MAWDEFDEFKEDAFFVAFVEIAFIEGSENNFFAGCRNERPQLRPHAWGLHAKWSAGTALPDAETREESRAEGADS